MLLLQLLSLDKSMMEEQAIFPIFLLPFYSGSLAKCQTRKVYPRCSLVEVVRRSAERTPVIMIQLPNYIPNWSSVSDVFINQISHGKL